MLEVRERIFPQSLEITKCGDFTHSHRTTTTTHYDDNLALQKRRRFSGSSVHLVKSYAGFSIAWSYLLFRPFGAL
jgi:hypothetical protein